MVEKNSLQIGKRIREVRRIANLTQEQLALKAGISTVTLNRYEKGHRSPDAIFLNHLVKNTGCDTMWLLTGENSASLDEAGILAQRADNIRKTEKKTDDPSLQRIIEILENDLPEDVEHILKILLARVQLKEGFTYLGRYP